MWIHHIKTIVPHCWQGYVWRESFQLIWNMRLLTGITGFQVFFRLNSCVGFNFWTSKMNWIWVIQKINLFHYKPAWFVEEPLWRVYSFTEICLLERCIEKGSSVSIPKYRILFLPSSNLYYLSLLLKKRSLPTSLECWELPSGIRNSYF